MANLNNQKYDPNLHPIEVVVLMQEGFTPAQCASKWKIARSTLENWKKSYPEFKAAFELGRTHLQARWETILQDNITNKGLREFSFNRFMINMFPDDHCEGRRLKLNIFTPGMNISQKGDAIIVAVNEGKLSIQEGERLSNIIEKIAKINKEFELVDILDRASIQLNQKDEEIKSLRKRIVDLNSKS